MSVAHTCFNPSGQRGIMFAAAETSADIFFGVPTLFSACLTTRL